MTVPATGSRTGSRPVLVRYFAAAADAARTEQETMDIPAEATVGWLRSQLTDRYGKAMTTAIRNGTFLVDGVAETDECASLGDSVDVLPPFAGG